MDKLDPTTRDTCGTTKGYDAHRHNNERFCAPCKEARSIYYAEWRAKNPDKSKTSSLLWKSNNKQKIHERYAKYYKEKPEVFRINERKRRARLAAVESSVYTTEEVLAVYGFECHICQLPIDLSAPRLIGVAGWETGLHLDHVVPISKGGSDTLKNVKPAHGMCNISKNARDYAETSHS
jgi:5-methylcytosine-specific restriction endonuclease McrA